MDVVSRIKLFLNIKGIANSIFADTCDIPRPTISQLLNGRNKKISNEVIAKIHAAYPELSIMWLMFGEEPMLNGVGKNGTTLENSEGGSTLSDFDKNFDSENGSEFSSSDLGLFDASENSSPTPVVKEEKNVVSEALAAIAKNMGNNKNVSRVGDSRHIVNIMVFYSDNSFESFVPNK